MLKKNDVPTPHHVILFDKKKKSPRHQKSQLLKLFLGSLVKYIN